VIFIVHLQDLKFRVFCTVSVLNVMGSVCFEKHLILTVVFI